MLGLIPNQVVSDIKTPDRLPEGTTVTWKQGEELDPKTPGTTDSHVIVTIPGQDPVEISTKVTITAKTPTDTSDEDKPPVIPPAPEGHKPEETKPPKKEPKTENPWVTNSGVHGEGLDARERRVTTLTQAFTVKA